MKEAIKLAVKGGYTDGAHCNEFDMYESSTNYCHSTVLIDPLFWSSLGKSLNWGKEDTYFPHRIGSHSDDYGGDSDFPCYCNKPKDWKEYWHNFIDHLAENKDIDSFFTNLINPK